MRLIERNGKFLTQHGWVFKEYLDMKTYSTFFWWSIDSYINKYCLAESEEQALKQLAVYRQNKKNDKDKSKTKVLKWFV